MFLTKIDHFLNAITMYKLVLLSLGILAVIAIIMGFLGILPFSGVSFGATLIILMATCYVAQKTFDHLFHAVSNTESYQITALILFFIVSPILSFEDFLVTIAVGILAIASKYILAVDKKHIFNPAAIAIVLIGLFGFGNGIWWVGSAVILPCTIIIGFLIVRKIRRFYLLWSFLFFAILSSIIFNLQHGLTIDQILYFLFASSPLIFFGTIMLTEPITTPPQKKQYMTYAAIVGILFSSQFHIGPLFASPELALVLGNIISYVVSPKKKLFLTLEKTIQLSSDTYEFIFKKPTDFLFQAGQYVEWTVPHTNQDLRGNRRYFTIASAPTEDDIRLGIKLSPNGSSYKKALMSLPQTTPVIASQLSGEFILPKNTEQKLVFIAGGIGVTPFRSMVQQLLNTHEKRDIIFFYTASTEKNFVYKNIFDKASKALGLKVVYIVTDTKNSTWNGPKGRITPELLKKHIPDIQERKFYLSGPNTMVEAYKQLLKDNDISSSNIVTDYFPGFA